MTEKSCSDPSFLSSMPRPFRGIFRIFCPRNDPLPAPPPLPRQRNGENRAKKRGARKREIGNWERKRKKKKRKVGKERSVVLHGANKSGRYIFHEAWLILSFGSEFEVSVIQRGWLGPRDQSELNRGGRALSTRFSASPSPSLFLPCHPPKIFQG